MTLHHEETDEVEAVLDRERQGTGRFEQGIIHGTQHWLDDQHAMAIDPNPPGVTLRKFTKAEIAALEAMGA